MTARILDGREVAECVKKQIADEVKKLSLNLVWSPFALAKMRLRRFMSATKSKPAKN